ncbi:hypothetical protein ACIBBE_46900 [Streptomyces sp. NPDC051644]|uniref:hypothetical protein n=1 Tax=Streptomyces sp. NPDC051644 TaxID=3365666 RepID=UPI0037A112F0
MRELPSPPPALTGGLRANTQTPWAEGTGPVLPLHDFPVFLAACRHKLPGNTFTAVRDAYDHEVHAADQWHLVPDTPAPPPGGSRGVRCRT